MIQFTLDKPAVEVPLIRFLRADSPRPDVSSEPRLPLMIFLSATSTFVPSRPLTHIRSSPKQCLH